MSDDVADRTHPAAETLSAYQANELSPEESGAIRQHVADCTLCAERLLDLQRFLEFTPEGQTRRGVADLETTVEWRRLRERIEKEQIGLRRRRVPGARRLRWALRSPRTAYGLAAVLILTLVGLSIYTARLRRELSGPEMNPRTVFLPTVTMARGSEDLVKAIDLAPREEARITFILEAPHTISLLKYRLKVEDHQGRLIVERDDLTRQGEVFTFTLPSEGLAPGRYFIQVLGLRRAAPPREVGRYEFRIRRS